MWSKNFKLKAGYALLLLVLTAIIQGLFSGPALQYQTPRIYTAPTVVSKQTQIRLQKDVRRAIVDLEESAAEDRIYFRYFSASGIPSSKIEGAKKFLYWWVNQLSFSPAVVLPVEIHHGLYRVDIREYLWNADAWASVSKDEPFFREPNIAWYDALMLRELIDRRDTRTTPTRDVEAVVSLHWFIHWTTESNLSDAYKDLLFAQDRFVFDKEIKEPYEEVSTLKTNKVFYSDAKGNLKHPQTGYMWVGQRPNTPFTLEILENVVVTKYRVKYVASKRNFPKNLKEWEAKFGITAILEDAKKRAIDPDFGGIAFGGFDYPGSSRVARRNRLIRIIFMPLGGAHMQTFDVTESIANKNFLDALIFAGRRFAPGSGAQAEFDAGEILTQLPNGGQAALLIDKDGNEVKVAAGTFAQDTADPNRLNIGVRTVGSCIVCHEPGDGYHPYVDRYGENARFIRYESDNKHLKNRVAGYFEQRDISKHMDGYRSIRDKAGLKAGEPARFYNEFRAWYDDPIDYKQASLELGVDEGRFLWACSEATTSGLLRLVAGLPIDRTLWDKQESANAVLLLELDTYEN